jgi:hypothetical protein
MAWQMLRVAVQVIRTERDIAQNPFAALCAVLRGAIVVLETRAGDDHVVMTKDDLEGMKRIGSWFKRRWRIGEVYMTKLEELLHSIAV